MPMLVINWRKVVCLFCASTSLAVASFDVIAVDQSQLWLPRNYYRHFKSLYHAAEVAEATERCRYVIAGTVNLARSSHELPIFQITCRDSERQTFAWIIDGLSYDILNLPPPPDPEMVAQQQLREKLQIYWSKCFSQLKTRAGSLRGLAWQTQEMPEAEMAGENDIRFSITFNAIANSGRRLSYIGECHFAEENKTVLIHPWVEPEEPENEALALQTEGS